MLVKIKKEIITMRMPLIKPELGRAPVGRRRTRSSAGSTRAHDDDGKPVVMMETRNAFEVDVGTFDNTLDYRIDKFTEFPDVIAAHKDELAGKTVVTFCTGGIRCEKAAIHMKEHRLRQRVPARRRHPEVFRRSRRRALHGRLLRVRLPHRAQSETGADRNRAVLRLPRRRHAAPATGAGICV